MSRIGRKPVVIPDKVNVNLQGQKLEVKGPLGTLSTKVPLGIKLNIDKSTANVDVPEKTRSNQGYQGLVRSLLANMIEGVHKGYERKLEISGVGYKAELKGNVLSLALGYSHIINFAIPNGIKIDLEKQTGISVKGIDKQLVGQVAAQIRSFREPEPYKGKGVKYSNEVIRRKVGKAGAR